MKPPERAAGFCCLGWFGRIGIFAKYILIKVKNDLTPCSQKSAATIGVAPEIAQKRS